jgi:hypothetical protein
MAFVGSRSLVSSLGGTTGRGIVHGNGENRMVWWGDLVGLLEVEIGAARTL